MKRIVFVLIVCMLVAGTEILAQTVTEEVTVRPIISTTPIASNIMVTGSKNIRTAAKSYGSVVVGQRVFGSGIPYGTTVAALVDPALDSIITLSNAATASQTVTLDFGYFKRDTSTVGAFCGMPFEIPIQPYPYRELASVTVIDTSATSTTFRILLTSSGEYAAYGGLNDQVATQLAPASYLGRLTATAADTMNLSGGIYAANQTVGLVLPPQGKLYGRLMHTAAVTYVSTQPLTLKFRFKK